MKVTGDDRGRVTATTSSNDEFDRCFVAAASQLETGGGAYDTQPKRFSFTLTVAIANLQQLFDKRVAAMSFDDNCWPRPGAIPEEAMLALASDRAGLIVVANTRPDNAEVNRCLEKRVGDRLRDFAGIGNLRATRRLAITSRLEPKRFRDQVTAYAQVPITDCYPKKGLPPTIKVTVTAKRDAADFTIADDSGHPEFSACLREKLAVSLRDTNLTSREVAPGKYEPYRRIDRDVDITAVVKVETPEAREKRRLEQKRRLDEDRYR